MHYLPRIFLWQSEKNSFCPREKPENKSSQPLKSKKMKCSVDVNVKDRLDSWKHREIRPCDDHVFVKVFCSHPTEVKCAGTAITLPWNSHIHYAGTAYASPAIPTSAIKNALEQPWRKTGQPRLWLFQRIFLWLFPPDCSRVTVPASLFPRGCSPVVIMDVPEWMF